MKNVSQWALISPALVLGIAYACATPEEIRDCPVGTTRTDCDVTIVPFSEFEGADASVEVAQGGSDGLSPSGGSSGSNTNPPAGGAAGTSPPPPSGGSAGQGAAGSGQAAGAGGASGGTAGSGAGTGGGAGSGAAGTAGTAGAGGTTAQSTFNPAACDFDDTTGCQNLGCICAGEQCGARCTNIVQCLKDNITCITASDPLCAARTAGAPNLCTAQVDTGGGANTTDPNQPAAIVRALVNCVCSDPRP
jgi:hypothetical protein